jgi:hypothetical protein
MYYYNAGKLPAYCHSICTVDLYDDLCILVGALFGTDMHA